MSERKGRRKAADCPTPRRGDPKQQILNSPNWLADGLEHCHTTGEWPEWETRVLERLATGDNCLYWAVRYATEVMGHPWNALEPLMLDVLCASGPVLVEDHDAELVNVYVEQFGRSSGLERLILKRKLDWVAILYAKQIFPGRWRKAEQLILDAEKPGNQATLCCFDEDDSGVIESQIVVYARDCIGGRWPAFEKKVRLSDCHPLTAVLYSEEVVGKRWRPAEVLLRSLPKTNAVLSAVVLYARDVIQGRWPKAESILQGSTEHMLQYADEVLEGRLPDHLHVAMTLSEADEYTHEYFAKYGV